MRPHAAPGIEWRACERRKLRNRIGTLLLTLLVSHSAAAQDDIVVTANGNTLTGEIKSLDRGLLRFDMDATDTIEIFWTHVVELTSTQRFLVTLDDGRQLFGTLAVAEGENRLRIITESAQVDMLMTSIVRMTPIEGRLLDRIDMSVDLGYNLAKASSLSQATFGYDFSYRSEERQISLNIDASRSSSNDNPTSHRSNSTINYRRFSPNRQWDPVGFGGVERNDELGLDRRVTLGGGMARWLTDTNSKRISFIGGLVATRENETEALDSDDNIEAAVGFNLDWFRYDDPELDVSLRLSVYERFSGTSRTRGNLDIDLRWELVSDFFWGFSVYYTFNTEPTGEAAREDYGVVTTVGWSF